MTDSSPSLAHDGPELDPGLEEWLGAAREIDADASPIDLEGMFGAVEGAIEDADRRPLSRLRAQRTGVRRAIAAGAALTVLGAAGVMVLRADLASYPPLYMAIAVLALATLLGLSVHQALRPLHRPPLPLIGRVAIVGLTLATTLALALLSPHDATDPATTGLLQHVSPCLFYGLLVGVPIFALLRALDRGAASTSLIAACAGGLAGNLALQLHCQHNEPEHLMLAHFGVVALFVVGLGAVQLVTRALER